MSKIKVEEIFEKQPKRSVEKVTEENQKLEKVLMEEGRKDRMNADVLSKLKSKMTAKTKEEVPVPEPVPSEPEPVPQAEEVSSSKEVSITMSVFGVGQAGSRIAEEFHKRGYPVGIINTSSQDLKFIDVPDDQKMLLEMSLGGTGKDLNLGREIFEAHSEQIEQFCHQILGDSDMAFLAVSGGGGTGSSSVDVMVQTLFSTGKPVGVIYVLPKTTEDVQSKKNSIETLSRLAKMASDNQIASLIVVDNARIEAIYGGLSQSKFWETANSAIVEPIDLFNSLTSQPSKHTSLDPSDFGKIISAGDCSVYGVIEVEEYLEETALAEAVIESLGANMLAEGFDLNQTRTGGVILVGSESAISQIPSVNIDYMFHMISEKTNGAAIFQGIYTDESIQNGVKIYSWFAGLGLPQNRIESLKKESRQKEMVQEEKQKQRASAMSLDLEEDKTASVADKIHKKISAKNSGFNKLQSSVRQSIIDRRKK